jgi:hypothetical protein
LVPTTSLQLQRREIASNLKLFALIDDVGGNSGRVIVLAEVRSRDVVGLEEILDKTK